MNQCYGYDEPFFYRNISTPNHVKNKTTMFIQIHRFPPKCGRDDLEVVERNIDKKNHEKRKKADYMMFQKLSSSSCMENETFLISM